MVKRDDVDIVSQYNSFYTESTNPSGHDVFKDITYTTDEQVYYNLRRLIYAIRSDLPKIGLILLRMGLQIVDDSSGITTAAVSETGNLYFNKDFYLNKLSNWRAYPGQSQGTRDDYAKSILIHEALHIVYNTFERLGGRDRWLWNLASDFIINRDIVMDEQPWMDGFFTPEVKNNTATITERYEDIFIPDSLPLDVSRISTERIYSKLKINKDQKEIPDWLKELFDQFQKEQTPPEEGDDKEGKSNPNPSKTGKPGAVGDPKGNHKSGSGSNSGEPDKKLKAPSGQQGRAGFVDKHITKEEEEQVKQSSKGLKGSPLRNEKISETEKIQIEQDARRLEHEKRERGRGGSGIDRALQQFTVSSVDFKKIFNSEIKSRLDQSQRSYARGFSYGGMVTGKAIPRDLQSANLSNIAVYVDTSGSMSEKDVKIIFGYLEKLIQTYPHAGYLIVLWTEVPYSITRVKPNQKFKPGLLQSLQIKTGGNDLQRAYNVLTDTKYLLPNEKCDAVVILSDFADSTVIDKTLKFPLQKLSSKKLSSVYCFNVDTSNHYTDIMRQLGYTKIFNVSIK